MCELSFRLARGTPGWIGPAPFILVIILAVSYALTEDLIWAVAAASLLAGWFLILLFFRDPERGIGEGVVSPADGRVLRVEKRGRMWFVSIFMNVHNVHVNRAPWSGRVLSVMHKEGSFKPAFSKESDDNERVVIRIRTRNGVWVLTQIAGIVARRIVPYVSEGDTVERGERIGIIRFGSRVDLLFRPPVGTVVVVSEGERVRAGISSLAAPKRERRG